MTQTKREIERKYEPPATGYEPPAEGNGPPAGGTGVSGLPDLTGVPGVASAADRGTVRLDAVYYDTADHRLAADRVTLRRRTGGSDPGWHLKLPVSLADGVREEIQAPLEDEGEGRPAGAEADATADVDADVAPVADAAPAADTGAGPVGDPTGAVPPAVLTALLRSRTRDAPLVPVMRLRTARTLRLLVDAAGRTLAEVSVDRVRAERPAAPATGTGTLGGPGGAGGGPRSGDGEGGDPGSGGAADGGGTRTAEWTEAEVELADDGPRDLLDLVEERLGQAGWRRSRSVSKLARALHDTAPGRDGRTGAGVTASAGASATASGIAVTDARVTSDGATAASRGTATPHDTAAGCVLAYLRAQRDALVDLDPAVRRDLPDAVHRMRVATRRARSTLRSYRTVLDRTGTGPHGTARTDPAQADPARTDSTHPDPIGTELKWLAAELGVGRDREVLAERLTGRLADLPPDLCEGPVSDRLRAWSDSRGAAARHRLLAVLDGPRYLALLAALDTLLAAPPPPEAATESPQKVLGRAVRRQERRLAARLDEAQRQPPGAARDVALHEARKVAKRLRYAAEAATPVLGHHAKRTVARAKDLQSLIGDHQDSVMARGALRELAGQAHAAGESTFTYGLLYGREEAAAARGYLLFERGRERGNERGLSALRAWQTAERGDGTG